MNRVLHFLEKSKVPHLFLDIGSADRRSSGCDPHNTVRLIHAVAEKAKEDAVKEAFYTLSHLMKHDRHGKEWLQRCNAGFVELLDQVLACRRLESKLLIGFTSIVLSNVLPKVLFLAFFDLDHSTLISVARGQLDVRTQPRIFHELEEFVIVNPIRSILVVETKEGNKCVFRQDSFVFPCAFNKLFFVQYSVALLIECMEQIACIVRELLLSNGFFNNVANHWVFLIQTFLCSGRFHFIAFVSTDNKSGGRAIDFQTRTNTRIEKAGMGRVKRINLLQPSMPIISS
jgi:hypothetical protein